MASSNFLNYSSLNNRWNSEQLINSKYKIPTEHFRLIRHQEPLDASEWAWSSLMIALVIKIVNVRNRTGVKKRKENIVRYARDKIVFEKHFLQVSFF